MYDLGNIKLTVAQDYEVMSKICADKIALQIRSKKDSVLGLATGSTPEGAYKELVNLSRNGKVDFSQVTTFNLDEYFPISKLDPQSYWYFMHKNLFEHVGMDKGKINVLNGEALDAHAECERYEKKIAEAGGIDLQLLGVGLNGHIGFNEPSDIFSRTTHIVNLEKSTIDANSRFFDSIDDVPTQAITMGIKTIMSAAEIIMIVSGKAKAQLVSDAFTKDVTPLIPASVLQLHRNVSVIVDKDAAEIILKNI